MANQASLTWFGRDFKKISLSHPLTYAFIFFLIYGIYYFFSTKVLWFEWNIYHNFQSLSVSILIAYLLAGIQILSNRIRNTLKYVDLLYDFDTGNIYAKLEERLSKSYINKIILKIFVIGPFIILSWGILPYHEIEPENRWAIGLDIYGYLLLFAILFLFSEILWILFNIILFLNDVVNISNERILNIDVFSIILKLRPLKKFLLIFIIIYFFAITLAITAYIGPSNVFPYEIVFFAALLLAGVILFFLGLEVIQFIIDRQVEHELDILNEKRMQIRDRFMSIICQEDISKEKDKIDNISAELAFIQKEKTELMELNRRAYDISSISIFIGSFLIPLVTLIKELMQIKL